MAFWKSQDEAAKKIAAEQNADFHKVQNSLKKTAEDAASIGATDKMMEAEVKRVDHFDKHSRGEDGALGR